MGINGLDIANESLKLYSEFVEEVIKFNANTMRIVLNLFLNLAQPKQDNKNETWLKLNGGSVVISLSNIRKIV